jgi:hypothetical protein
LAAVFDAGPLVGRAGSAVTLATILVCLAFALLNVSRRGFSARNLFWPTFLLLVLCSFSINIATDDPDTTIAFLAGAVFWTAWTWLDWGLGKKGGWVLILIGAGGMSIKLSGALLLVATFVVALTFAGLSKHVLLKYSGLLLALTAPVLAVQGITSGHPLYPAVSLALPVSWAVPDTFALAMRDSIARYALYGYDQPWPMTSGQKAEKILFEQQTHDAPYIFSVLLVFFASAAVACRQRRSWFPVAFAASLGGIGLMMLIQVPQIRFTIGYLAVLPALMLAYHPRKVALGVCAATLAMMYLAGPGTNRLDIARMAFYLGTVAWLTLTSFPRTSFSIRVLIGCLFVSQLMRPVATVSKDIPALIRRPAWVLAPSGPLIPPDEGAFTEGELGEVRYKQPVDGYSCWAESLPCAPPPYQANWLTLNALWYRCNAHRLDCGFTATPPAISR